MKIQRGKLRVVLTEEEARVLFHFIGNHDSKEWERYLDHTRNSMTPDNPKAVDILRSICDGLREGFRIY